MTHAIYATRLPHSSAPFLIVVNCAFDFFRVYLKVANTTGLVGVFRPPPMGTYKVKGKLKLPPIALLKAERTSANNRCSAMTLSIMSL